MKNLITNGELMRLHKKFSNDFDFGGRIRSIIINKLKNEKMKTYIYYSKLDNSKEAISRKQFINEDSAIEYWSKVKRLTVDQFTDLYKVENKD